MQGLKVLWEQKTGLSDYELAVVGYVAYQEFVTPGTTYTRTSLPVELHLLLSCDCCGVKVSECSYFISGESILLQRPVYPHVLDNTDGRGLPLCGCPCGVILDDAY